MRPCTGSATGALQVLVVAGVLRSPLGLRAEESVLEPDVPNSTPAVGCGGESCTARFRRCAAARWRQAAQNCGGRCDVVLVGDSILERMTGRTCYSGLNVSESGAAFLEAFGRKRPRVLNLGGASDMTQQVLYNLDGALPVLKAPAAYLVLAGTNNIPQGGRPSALRGIRAIVGKLRGAHPASKVLLHPVLGRFDDNGKARFQERIDALNKDLAELVREERSAGAQIEMVDCLASIGTPAQAPDHYADRLHPSPAGYRAWLDCLGPAVDSAMAGRHDI